MAGQTLETLITINAKTGNGFSQVGATLAELGSIVNGISQDLINFGKESVEVYKDYEYSMADAEGALARRYGKGTAQLKQVMKELDTNATEWAATSIFHIDDIGNAIDYAAHAGWDLNQILGTMPSAMQLAQAGGLDLSEALDYIIKTSNAAGIEFKDLNSFIDAWVFAANSSASNVGEIGDAMLKMGSTMRFTDSTNELLTLIAVTADAGSVGTEAGTMIRNSIMRLVAPTAKAKKAFAQLNATALETSEVMNDEALAAANATLASTGFSVYYQDGEKKGQMKNVLDIYKDMYEALGLIAGGYENIQNNEDAMEVIGAIFPTRNVTEALTLLRGAATDWNGLFDALERGDQEGYGAYVAGVMMNTVYGAEETFESKVERLKQLTGEELSGQLRDVLGTIGGFVDKIATMDSANFSALVAGLEVIAGAGPMLLLGSAAFRFLGQLLTPGVGWMMAAIGITAFAAAFERLDQINYEHMFGENGLDMEAINTYLGDLGGSFKDANQYISEFQTSMEEAIAKYESSGQSLTSRLVTAMLTGKRIEPGSEEHKQLMGLVDDIGDATKAGIDGKRGLVRESIMKTMATGGDASNPIWAQLMEVINQGFDQAIEDAEALSEKLRKALSSAFEDGQLTAEEIENYMSIMNQYDALLAQQRDRENYLEGQRILRQARTLGLEAITSTADQITALRDEEQEALMQRQDASWYDLNFYWDQLIKNGGTVGGETATQAMKDAAMAELKEAQEKERADWAAEFNDLLLGIYIEGAKESEFGDTWEGMTKIATNFREAGGVLTTENYKALQRLWGDEARYLNGYIADMIEPLGGYESLAAMVKYHTEHGETDLANQYRLIMDLYDIVQGNRSNAQDSPDIGATGNGDYSEQGMGSRVRALIAGEYGEKAVDSVLRGVAEDVYIALNNGFTDWDAIFGTVGNGSFLQSIKEMAQESGMSIAELLNQALSEQEINPDVVALQNKLAELEAKRKQYEDEIETQEKWLSGEDRPLLWFEGATRDALFGRGSDPGLYANYEEIVGQIAEVEAQIKAITGEEAQVTFGVDDSQVQAWEPPDKEGNVTYRVNNNGEDSRGYPHSFAEGGRATEASIFGEAGAEWAIPEEHSDRTAELLNSARKASGFTWQELLERFGGLNANTGNSGGRTLVYSPTINATDARGVEEALQNDKKRLAKWLNDRDMRDAAEVYA